MDKIKFLLERVRLSFGRNHVISAVPLQKPKIKKKKKKKKTTKKIFLFKLKKKKKKKKKNKKKQHRNYL
jgi:hypothetical protein